MLGEPGDFLGESTKLPGDHFDFLDLPSVIAVLLTFLKSPCFPVNALVRSQKVA